MGNCSSCNTQPGSKKNTSFVEVRSATWSRESHGLFDYENKNSAKKNLQVNALDAIMV